MNDVIICLSPDQLPHEFEVYGRHRKPHCTYCGQIQRADNVDEGCYERPIENAQHD